jgi:hypothetical protein
VLLDDREQVGEELALEVGEVGAGDQRDDVVLDGVDGAAPLRRLRAPAGPTPVALAVVGGLAVLGSTCLGLQAARAVALVRNRNPSS